MSSHYYGILLYERLVNGSLKRYEEIALVVQAKSGDEAHAEILRLARKEEGTYEGMYGDTVSVVLKELIGYEKILCEEIYHGCVIFSRWFKNLDAYNDFIDSFDPA